jgi:hypothetical protein
LNVAFSSAEAVTNAFREDVLTGAVVVIAMVIAAIVISRTATARLRLKTILGAGSLVFAAIGVNSYGSTYGCFVSADVTPAGMTLRYTGPQARDVFVPRETVDTVLFGLPGKAEGKCYLRVLQKSGTGYRSATLPMRAEPCKALRSQILSTLSVDG